MRAVSFSSAILAVAALLAVGCEGEEPSETMTGQSPGVAGQVDGGVPDASGPGPGPTIDASQPTLMEGGAAGGADSGPSTPRTEAGVSPGNQSDAGGAGTGDAAMASDGGVAPSEAGASDWSPCPGGGMPCKILPLGDSITYGIDSQGSSTGSYRVELFRKARAANQNITFVGKGMASGPTMVDSQPFPRANEGHSGWTISQIANRVPSPALDDKPHITLLMIGTNDVTFGSASPMRLGMLIDELVDSDPNMLVVVAQITPRGSAAGGPSPHAATETFNRGIPAEVERRASMGKHVLLVDMYTDFPKTGLSDFVHPNKTGYDWMAGVWYMAIGSLLR